MPLSDEGTLIVPVDPGSQPPSLRLGSLTFVAKKEHHLTVLGRRAGQHLREVCATAPGLRDRIDALAASFAWAVTPLPDCYHLARPHPEGGTLQTILRRVDARIDAFRGQVRELLRHVRPEAPHAPPPPPTLDDLLAALAQPAFPHVTLYTTDPAGLEGIGVYSRADLDAALQRATSGDRTGLAAFLLGPGVVDLY